MVDPSIDVVVVGGGIHGTGIARDAARRGLRVVLVERGDLAQATSGASSKLAHGGLRYLEQFQVALVREGLRERHTLLRIAPHLVRPLPFLVPLGDRTRWGRAKLGAGLWLYDLLAGRRVLERHRHLDHAATVEAEPVLDRAGLTGSYRYVDAQMDDARLCVENAIDAAEHGAQIHTCTEAIGLLVHDGAVRGVRVRDARGERDLSARLVLNASGPWYAELSSSQLLTRPVRVRLSRGAHLVVPPITRGHALLLNAPDDGRVVFVIPFKGRSLIGTTEIEHHDGPGAVSVTEAEIDYLLHTVNSHLSGPPLERSQVLFSFAGVRTLRDGDESDPGRLSREAEIREDAPGLLGVFGGKYTAYRATAQHVTDAIERRVRGHVSTCTTRAPLPGGDVPAMNDYFRVAEDLLAERYAGLDVDVLRYLVGTYGARHTQVLRLLDDDPDAIRRIEPGLPFTFAEVEHCVRHEFARSVEDVVRRRCYRAYLGGWTDEAQIAWERAFERALERTARLHTD